MNKPAPLPSSTLLNGGEIVSVSLKSGATTSVKVCLLPLRNLNHFLDLRDVGLEADMLAFVLRQADGSQFATPGSESSPAAASAAAADFVDSLSDDSHELLVEIADKLNFSRAVWQAERQIERQGALLPLKQRVAESMVKPIEEQLRSLTRSAITSALSESAAKQP